MTLALYILGLPLAWDRAEIDNNWVRSFVALLWPIIPFTMFLYWLIVGHKQEIID